MKQIAIYLIIFYQLIIANALLALGLKTDCRYSETCSDYTKRSIREKGVLRGAFLGIMRILSCQPFFHK